MNELDKVLSFIPEKYRGAVVLTVMLSPYVTRAAFAVMNGGGIRGILVAIWLGNNPRPTTPPPTPTP